MKMRVSTLTNWVFIVSFLSVALGHRFYFLLGGKVVPGFFMVIPIVFICLLVFFSRVVVKNVPAYVAILLALLSLYAVLSALIFDRYQDISQLIIFLFIPLVFFGFGFLVSPARIVTFLNLTLIFSALFAFAQIAYTSFGYAGPGGLFAAIKEHEYAVQDEVLKRTLSLRATGLFVEPNLFGFYSGLCFFWLLQARGFLKPWLVSVGLYFATFCVIASMSRGSIVALITALGLKVLISTLRLRITLSGIVGVLVGGGVIAMMVAMSELEQFERIGEILGVISKGSSESANLDARYTAWSSLVELVYENPLGVVQPPQMVIDDSPDNQYLYLALQGGLLLFSSFVFFCVFTLKDSLASVLRDKSDFFYCAIFFMVNNLSITAMNSFCTMIFWLAFGLFAAQVRTTVGEKFLVKG